MSLFVRFFFITITAFFRKRLGVLEESVLDLRVLPNDLDANGHMNNGRYLTIMDLGRIDMVVRMGLADKVIRRIWYPIVAASMIYFNHSLKPFQHYQLRSRIVYWDQKWFFVEQRFERAGTVVAVAVVKSLFRNAQGNIPTADLLAVAYHPAPGPPLPPAIDLWLQAEATLRSTDPRDT